MIDMPSLGDAVALRSRITELEAEVKRLNRVVLTKNQTIARIRRSSGVKARTSKTEVANMLIGGASDAEIIAAVGCHKTTVSRIKKQLGLNKKAAKVS